MNVGKTLFAQLMAFVPWTSFGRIVDRYGGNTRVRRLSGAEQFRVIAFAQLTWRESLRDIEVTLGAHPNKLYGMGFPHSIRRSTLADASESRDWRIWPDLAALVIKRARKLYGDTDLVGPRAQEQSLCIGLHHDRPVPESVRLGQLSTDQSSG